MIKYLFDKQLNVFRMTLVAWNITFSFTHTQWMLNVVVTTLNASLGAEKNGYILTHVHFIWLCVGGGWCHSTTLLLTRLTVWLWLCCIHWSVVIYPSYSCSYLFARKRRWKCVPSPRFTYFQHVYTIIVHSEWRYWPNIFLKRCLVSTWIIYAGNKSYYNNELAL